MKKASKLGISPTEAWFDEVISTLRAHQLQLETNTASPDVKRFYDIIFGSDPNDVAHIGKVLSQKHFIPRIIYDFIRTIDDSALRKLAFDFNDSEVLVWAEISDDDEKAESTLLKAEAQLNAKYHPFGFDLETTIVEESDNIPIPNHYRVYKS